MLGLPPIVVAQKMLFVKRIERRFHKHVNHAHVADLLEPAIAGERSAPNNGEAPRRDLPAEQVVFSKQSPLVEPSQLIELPLVEQHEHPSAEGLPETGYELHDVVSEVKRTVSPVPISAPDVGGKAVQPAPLHLLHCAAKKGG